MNEQQKTGSSMALGIVSIILGVMVMLFSFIPCIGSYGVFLSIIPILLGATGYYIAKTSDQPTGTSLGGLMISMLAFFISGYQYYSIISASNSLQNYVYSNKHYNPSIPLPSDGVSSIPSYIYYLFFFILLTYGIRAFILFTNRNKSISKNPTNFENPLQSFNMSKIFNSSSIISLTCPTCNNHLNKNDVYCNSCGTNVQSHIKINLLANCPSCNNSISSNDAFCASCGYNILQYKQSSGTNQIQNIQPILLNGLNNCSNCGNSINAGDSFCENCGNKLK